MKVLVSDVAKSSLAFRALASSPMRWISRTLPLLDTTKLESVSGYEATGLNEALLIMLSPGKYSELISITSVKVKDNISVPRSRVYETSSGGMESAVMLVTDTATDGCSMVLPKMSTAEPFSSETKEFWLVVAKSGKLFSPFRSCWPMFTDTMLSTIDSTELLVDKT